MSPDTLTVTVSFNFHSVQCLSVISTAGPLLLGHTFTMNSSIVWILRDASRLQVCVLSYESLLSFNKCGNETVVFFQLCSTSLTLQVKFCCLSGSTGLLMYFLFIIYFGSRFRKLHWQVCGYRILSYLHCI